MPTPGGATAVATASGERTLRSGEAPGSSPESTARRTLAARATALGRAALPALWILGAAIVLLRFLREHRRFARSVARFPLAADGLTAEVARESRRLGLARTPEVRVTDAVLSPMVWSARWRPLLIFPEALIDRLSADERRTLILHELAHVRRRDHRVRYLELVVRIVHWCNPLAWWAIQELRAAEEECCDAWVTTVFHDSARPYSAALLAAAEFLSTDPRRGPATSTGAGPVLELKRRLRMIYSGTSERSLGVAGRLALVLVGMFAIPVLPGFAQQAPAARGGGGANVAAIEAWLAADADAECVAQGHASDPAPAEVARAVELAIALLHESGNHREAGIIRRLANEAAEGPSRGQRGSVAATSPVYLHYVAPGESMVTIAARYSSDPAFVHDLLAANGMTEDTIVVGQKVIVPLDGSVEVANLSTARRGNVATSSGGRRPGGASVAGARSGGGLATSESVHGQQSRGVNVAGLRAARTEGARVVGRAGRAESAVERDGDLRELREQVNRLAQQLQRLTEELDRRAAHEAEPPADQRRNR